MATKTLEYHLKRMRDKSPTRWSRGTGTRTDNVRKFIRYLNGAAQLLEQARREAPKEAVHEALILFYSSVLGFAKNMEGSNPTPFYDAFHKRKLRSLCDPQADNYVETPDPDSPQSPRQPGAAGSGFENGLSPSTIQRRVDFAEDMTIMGVDHVFTESEVEAIPTIPGHEIKALIGQGGVGKVYRGRQPFLDREVAIKILSIPDRGRRQDIAERFRREAKLLAGLNHPNIATCFQAGITERDELYITMELIEGPALDEYIRSKGALTERQGIEVVHQIAQALGFAQERDIIHRDVKGQNILLQPIDVSEGESQFPFIPKLVDLGLARFQYATADDEQLTIQGELIGTPSAMAPEQFENPEGVDHRTDIYSLGCVLYYALTGQPAFSFKTLTEIMRVKLIGESPNPAKIATGLSDLTVKLTRSMMAKKPADRPQTYKDLMTRCEDILRRLERAPGRGGPISKLVRRIGGSWSGGR